MCVCACACVCKGHVEYESRSAWTTIALIAGIMVPLLVGICCVLSQVYRRSGRLSLRYQTARAAKRRNSVMALSTVDLSGTAALGSMAGGGGEDFDSGGGGGEDDGRDGDIVSDSSEAPDGSVPSSTNPRRSYDAVYRTNEPLPGKPDVHFEPKVWDLDAEYERQLYKVDKRTAIYVPGSPPLPSSAATSTAVRPTDDDDDGDNAITGGGAAGPPSSVAVRRQILPSRFKNSF